MAVTIQVRRDTAANWVSVNPVLNQGEPGLETDTGRFKYGDGSTAWTSLGYAAQQLTPTTQTTTYTANPGDYVKANISSASWTMKLPNAPAANTIVGAKVIANATGNANTLTVACSGSDKFETSTGGTTTTLFLANQAAAWQYNGGYWTRVSDDLPLSQLGTVLVPLVNASPSTATGAAFNGSTDDNAALTNDQVASQALLLPNGISVVGTSVRIGQPGVHIAGTGMYSTTIRATAALNGILKGLASGFVSQVEISDLTLDGNSVANYAIEGYGTAIGRLILRRVRFINFPTGIIDAGYAARYIIEDCEADGAGLALGSFFTATNKPFESLILRRCRLRWLQNGILIGSSGYHAAYVEISGNDIDLGWWLLKSIATNTGTVTYTSTTVSDTGASFTGLGITTPQNVRAMPVRGTGTFTSNTTGTYLEDTSASFISDGVLRGEIVRSGTSFAVVSEVLGAHDLHVEEWLSQTTYQPVAPPASGATYTVYGIYIGSITTVAATTLTVAHGAGGGGGGWYDLHGNSQTPASGTLYEVLPARPNYPVFVTNVTEKLQVTGNRVRRGWSDNLELFGSTMVVTGNIVEDGQDEGIALQGNSVACGSVVSGNICKHNGTSGLTINTSSNIEVGPNQYLDNGWGGPAANGFAQLNLNGNANVTVTGGRAWNTGESTPQYGLTVDGSTSSGIKVTGFSGIGNAVADVYITDVVPAYALELIAATGVITAQAGGNPQVIQPAGIGTRVAYASATNSPTANSASSSLSTLTAFTSPAAPSITLPNDGHTYRVTLSAPSLEPSAQQVCGVGLGTSATAILKTTLAGFSGELNAACFVQVDVVASGQTINCYAYASSNGNVTIGCGATAGPAELSAVMVAQ